MPSNVLHLHLKQIFLSIIWILNEGEGEEIESRQTFKIFSTLLETYGFFKSSTGLMLSSWSLFSLSAGLKIGFGFRCFRRDMSVPAARIVEWLFCCCCWCSCFLVVTKEFWSWLFTDILVFIGDGDVLAGNFTFWIADNMDSTEKRIKWRLVKVSVIQRVHNYFHILSKKGLQIVTNSAVPIIYIFCEWRKWNCGSPSWGYAFFIQSCKTKECQLWRI